MKRVSLVLALVLGLGLSQTRAQEFEQAIESPQKQGVIGKVFGDMKESARTVRQINKENFSAGKGAYRTMYAQVTDLR